MKKIFRKNQLVITALALMIAVAGYFSYMNNNIEDNQVAAEASADADVLEGEYEISDEDILMESDIFTDEGTGDELALVDGTEVADAETVTDDGTVADAGSSDGETVADGTDVTAEGVAAEGTDTTAEGVAAEGMDQEAESVVAKGENAEVVADGSGATDVDNPGEAVLTSTSVANLDYAAEMKLNREQIRSKNKEALLEIVNNSSIEESLKQDAVNKMIAMTDIAEREAAAEMLLEAKGFTDVVVSITDDNCDVVLNMGEVTDAKRAQVEDIVKRKTNISAESIIITPIVVGEAKTE